MASQLHEGHEARGDPQAEEEEGQGVGGLDPVLGDEEGGHRGDGREDDGRLEEGSGDGEGPPRGHRPLVGQPREPFAGLGETGACGLGGLEVLDLLDALDHFDGRRRQPGLGGSEAFGDVPEAGHGHAGDDADEQHPQRDDDEGQPPVDPQEVCHARGDGDGRVGRIPRQVGHEGVDGRRVVAHDLPDRPRGRLIDGSQGDAGEGRDDVASEPVPQPRLGDVRQSQTRAVEGVPQEEPGDSGGEPTPHDGGGGVARPGRGDLRERDVRDYREDCADSRQPRRDGHGFPRGRNELADRHRHDDPS